MRNDFYPSGTVRTLLQTDLVLQQTKEVLEKRLNIPLVTEPSFFTPEEFITLQAVSNRLLPQPVDRKNHIDVAGIFDTCLKENRTENGWRYDAMPPDKEAFKKGFQAIEESSQSLYGKAFQKLEIEKQDAILYSVQQKDIKGKIWKVLPSHLFFAELMALLTEIYYSHPAGKDEIGDVSFADAKGWELIQLNQREAQEPKATNKNKEA